MGKRYTKTERLGINKTENFFLEEFDWIFRDQPLVDVGVDAIVEIQENGNPTGQFLALQIKAGKSHLKHLKREPSNYVYYTSNIHYNYWLKLNIPMLFVVYLPNKKKLYWQYILDENFEETSTQWKLKIPLKNVLTISNKNEIEDFVRKFQKDTINVFTNDLKVETIYDYIYFEEYVDEFIYSINKQAEYIDRFGTKITFFSEKIPSIQSIGEKNSFIKQVAVVLNLTASRLKNEMFIFSNSIIEAVYCYQMVSLIKIYFNQNFEAKTNHLKLISNHNNAITGIQDLYDATKNIPIIDDKLLIPKNKLLDVLRTLIAELKHSQELWQNTYSYLIKEFKSQTQK